jgi:DNA polymerase-1
VKLLLIDGHYYAYRSFFAIPAGLHDAAGRPTNAIYGFIKTVRKMLADVRPDRAAVCWDEGLPARRTELQPEYKTNRAETPEALAPQIDFLRALVPKMGLASLGVPDTEADDLMASYAVAAPGEVVLATNDKDLFQLVNERIRVYATNKADGTFLLLGTDEVRAKWGVAPAQIADVLALIGDSVDNIPGVPGIGPKTAAALITEHGSLTSLLADLSAVKSEKLRTKLEAARPQIAANREMVRLDDDLPLPVPLDELKIAPCYAEYVAALRECGFKSLLAEVEKEAAQADRATQGELF